MDKNNDVIIEKGKRVSEIISDINTLESVLNTIHSDITITIGTNTSGNLMKYNIFRAIVWSHIDKIKEELPKIIDELKKELSTLFK